MNAASWWGALDSVGFQTMRALLAVLWQSSLLLGAVAVLSRALRRRRASVRQALWVGALLAAPVLPLLAWVGSNLGTPQAQIPLMPTYSVFAERPPSAAPPPEFPEVPAAESTVESRGPLPDAGQEEEPVPFTLTDYPWALALITYLGGLALFLGIIVVGRHRLGRWVRTGVAVVDPRVLEAFRAAREQVGSPGDCLVVESDGVRAPLTVGAFRPVVLLPRGFARQLSQADLTSVALHEMAHVKRHDPLLLTLVSLVRAVFCFHPLVWVACRQVSLLAEQAADDAVLDATGKPIAYARLLVRVAQDLRRPSLTTELAAGIVLSKSAFLRRVEAILSDRRRQIRKLSRWALLCTVLAGLISLALAATLPLGERQSAPQERHTDVNLEEILDSIRQRQARVKTISYIWTSKRLIPKASMTVADPATGLPVPSDLPTEDTEIERSCTILIDAQKFRHDEEGLVWYEGRGTGEFVPFQDTLVFGADGVERCFYKYHDGSTGGLIGPPRHVTAGAAYEAMLQAYRLLDPVLGTIKPEEAHLVGRAELRGHPCLVVEKRREVPAGFTGDAVLDQWWLAEDMDHCVLRWEHKKDSGQVVIRLDSQYKPEEHVGWRLTSWSLTTWTGARGEPVTTTNVPTEIRLNEPIDAKAFDITFPPGTYVSDRLRGVEYRVGDEPESYPGGAVEGDMSFEERVLRVKLKWRLPFYFTDAPLEDVLDFARMITGIDILVDPQVQAERDEPKVTLAMRDAPLEEALDFIALVLNLEWSIRDCSVHISAKAKPTPAAAIGEPAPELVLEEGAGAALAQFTGRPGKQLTFESITAGIMASRSSLRSLRASYAVRYRDANWGWMEGEDGRPVTRDQYAGNHELVVDIAADDSLGDQRKLRWYLRCPMPQYGTEAEEVRAFDGEYQWCLYQPKTRRPWGTISARVDHSWFFWNSRIFDITYLVYSDTWEHALKTGTLALEGTDQIDGRACCVLAGRVDVLPDVGFAGHPVKVWVDPDRGFAIVRLEVYSRINGELDTFNSYDVLEVKKVAPDLWAPVRVIFRHGKEIAVNEIAVNEELPDSLFTIKFPDGTKVQDDRRGSSYTVADVPTSPQPSHPAEVGKPASDLLLEEEAHLTLAQFGGKPVVLAFVSVYSRPCVKVLDDLKALQAERGADKLAVIGVHDRTATPEEIEQFRKDHGIAFPIVRVPDAPRDGWDSATFRSYGVTTVPTVVFIDGKGKVVSAGDLNGLLEGAARSLAGWKSDSPGSANAEVSAATEQDSDETELQMAAWTKKRAALEAHFAGVAETDKERQKKWDLEDAEVQKMSSHDLCAQFLETPCGVTFDIYDDPNIGVERVRRSFNVLKELLDRADAVEAIGQYYAEYPFEAAVESEEGRTSTTPPYRCVTLLKFPPLFEKTRGREAQLLVALAEGDARIRRMIEKHGDASPFGLRSRLHAAELAEALWGQYDHDGYDKWRLQHGTTSVLLESAEGLAVYIDSLYREIVRVLPKKDPSSSSTLSAARQGSAPTTEPSALKRFHLRGRVLLPVGSPAAGATVGLMERDAVSKRWAPMVTRTTDDEGHYDLGSQAVPMRDEKHPSYAALYSTLKGYAIQGATVVFQRSGGPGLRALEVTKEQVTYDLKLIQSVSYGGTIVGSDSRPLQGVTVWVTAFRMRNALGRFEYIYAPTDYQKTETDQEGRFQVGDVPAGGTVLCGVEKKGHVIARFGLTESGDNTFALPEAGSIEGRIIFADTGKPAASVRVFARSSGGRRGHRDINVTYAESVQAVTDEQGRFKLEPLLPGKASVGIDLKGASEIGYTAEKGAIATVQGGGTTSGVVLELIKGTILRGLVVDAVSGKPVLGAHLQVDRSVGDGWEGYPHPETDAQGRYSLRVPAGTYRLRFADAEGYVTGGYVYGSFAQDVEFESVTVKEGQETQAPTIKAPPAATVTVKVRTPAGRPAPGILVNAEGDSMFGGASFGGPSGRTDDSGDVRFPGLKPGSTVQVSARNATGTLLGSADVTPKAGDENEVVIRLVSTSPGKVIGTLINEAGRAIVGAEVSLDEPSGDDGWRRKGFASSGAGGRFEMTGLSPGSDLVLRVGAPGYGWLRSQRFSLDSGQTQDMGTLTLARADREIVGRVVDRNDEPVADLQVQVSGRQSQPPQLGRTDKEGRFQFSGLVNEPLQIFVSEETTRKILATPSVQAGDKDIHIRIVSLGEEPKPDVVAKLGQPAPELVLEEGAGVSLTQFRGKPVVLAFVSIYSRPCVRVLDQLRALQEEKGAKALAVIAVHDRTATPEEIEQFRSDHSIPFPIVRVPDAARDGWDSATFRAYGVKALPTSVVIDSEGKVVSLGDGSKLRESMRGPLRRGESTPNPREPREQGGSGLKETGDAERLDIQLQVVLAEGVPATEVLFTEVLVGGKPKRLGVLSRQEGRFVLQDVQPGDVVELEAFSVPHIARLATSFQVRPAELEKTLTMKKVEPAVITGRLLEHRGTPLANTQIWLVEVIHDDHGGTEYRGVGKGITGPDGLFQVNAVSGGSGQGQLTFYTYRRDNLNFAYIRDQGLVSLLPGSTQLGDIKLPAIDKTVAGQVVDLDGGPIPKAMVWLNGWGDWSFSGHATTDDTGNFRVDNIPDGKVRIQVPPPSSECPSGEMIVVPSGTRDARVVMQFHQHPTEEPEEPRERDAAGAQAEVSAPVAVAEVGESAPELTLERKADITLAQFKGKPVVLAFVSIYSRPSVKVLDELKALQEEKGADRLAVIAVHDRTATLEEIEQFRNDHGISFPIVHVPDAPRDGWDSETFRAYGVESLPAVVRIDAEGKVVSMDVEKAPERPTRPTEKEAVVSEAPMAIETIEGMVRYGATGKPAAGATITLETFRNGQATGTSDEAGRFGLRVPRGLSFPYTLHARIGEATPVWEGAAFLEKSLQPGDGAGVVDITLHKSLAARQEEWLSRSGQPRTGKCWVAVLDNCDPDFRGKNEYQDTVTVYDTEGEERSQFVGLNACETVGGNHAIAWNTVDSSLWAVELVGDRVLKFGEQGRLVWSKDELEASALAIDPKTGNVWILTSEGTVYGRSLLVMSQSGEVLQEWGIGAFDITYSEHDDCFWVAGKKVMKVDRAGEVLYESPDAFAWLAVSVAVNNLDGSVWVAERRHLQVAGSRNRLFVFEPDGRVRKEVDLEHRSVMSVAVDSERQCAWAATYGGVLKFSLEGDVVADVPIAGFSLAIEPDTGYVWVGSGAGLYRLDGQGNLLWSKETPANSQKWLCVIAR